MTPSPDPRPTAPASDEALAAPRRGSVGFSWAKFNESAFASLMVAMMGVLMLVNINQTSDRITRVEDRITRLEEKIDTRFIRLEADINARFAAVDARFDKLEAEIDARFVRLEADIDARFAAVDVRFDKLEENQQEIAQTLARLVALIEAGDEGGG